MRVVPAGDVKQWFDHTRWRDWELRVVKVARVVDFLFMENVFFFFFCEIRLSKCSISTILKSLPY